MNKVWTDHTLLFIKLIIGISSAGKGIWEANSNLVKNIECTQI